jgi:23S rRNA (cytosine1962-C5)-methyltransferase
MHDAGGSVMGGEVGLPIAADAKVLPCGIFGRWNA